VVAGEAELGQQRADVGRGPIGHGVPNALASGSGRRKSPRAWSISPTWPLEPH
jgi:hypothetical protein